MQLLCEHDLGTVLSLGGVVAPRRHLSCPVEECATRLELSPVVLLLCVRRYFILITEALSLGQSTGGCPLIQSLLLTMKRVLMLVVSLGAGCVWAGLHDPKGFEDSSDLESFVTVGPLKVDSETISLTTISRGPTCERRNTWCPSTTRMPLLMDTGS